MPDGEGVLDPVTVAPSGVIAVNLNFAIGLDPQAV